MKYVDKYNLAFYSMVRNAGKHAYIDDASSHWIKENSDASDKSITELMEDLAEQYYDETGDTMRWELLVSGDSRVVFMCGTKYEDAKRTDDILRELTAYMYPSCVKYVIKLYASRKKNRKL
jgi:hypothetical protein